MKNSVKNTILYMIDKAYLFGGFWGVIKIFLSIAAHSPLIMIHAVYSIVNAVTKHLAKSNKQRKNISIKKVSILVMLASLIYLIYSLYIYCFGSDSHYHMYVAIGIAAITFYELFATVISIVHPSPNKDIYDKTIQYINLSSMMIALSLTQTAILSFTGEGDMSKYYAIGDAIFGMISLIIGIIMYIKLREI